MTKKKKIIEEIDTDNFCFFVCNGMQEREREREREPEEAGRLERGDRRSGGARG
jgi:hypothetical protein